MPVNLTQIIAEPVQHDGRRRYRCRYHTSEGDVFEHDFNLTPVGFDIDAAVVAKTSEIESNAKRDELFRAEAFLLGGGSLTAVQNNKKYNTNAEIGAFLLKRMANRLDGVSRDTLENDLPALFLLRDIFAEVTDAQIAGLTGAAVVDVAAWRVSFTTMRDGITGYSHSLPHFPEVEG